MSENKPNRPFLYPSKPWIPLAVFLAALGQYFLARSGESFTLWMGIAFYGAAWFCLDRILSLPNHGHTSDRIPSQTVFLIFSLILALALFFRLHQWDLVPPGLHTDQGLIGLSALRILREGWRPFLEVFDYQVPEPLLYYLLSLWFGLVGNSLFTFHLFFVLLSLAAFPLIYWTFQRLAGPRVALLALALLAVMRWHVTDSRNGYPSVQTPLFIFASLSLWVHFLESGKRWALALSAIVCGLGLYTYQAFKAFPLLILACAIYEMTRRVEPKRFSKRDLWTYILLAGIVASPLLYHMVQEWNPGNREKDLFIGRLIHEKKGFLPVLKNWGETALMFNRKGDMNPRHNIPGLRMFDDATGVLFLLGMGIAWKRRKERGFYYSLAGFFVFSLPCLLSVDSAHSNRMLAVTPFAAFFAAGTLDLLWGNALRVLPKPKFLVPVLVLFTLAGIALSNYKTYFVDQAKNEDCRRSFGLEQSALGKELEGLERQDPGRFHFFIAPAYFLNHTVAFPAYPARDRTAELDLRAIARGDFPRDRDSVFFLEKDKAGVAQFLKDLFPLAQEERIKDPDGRILLYQLKVGREELAAFKGWNRGLKGIYRNAPNWEASPVAEGLDPLLNFTGKKDFPFTNFPPFRVRWTGQLRVPLKGNYLFQVLTTDKAELWLDGRPVLLEKPISLAGGIHSLRLDFSKDQGEELALSLVWKKPGNANWEVIPATAF